MNKIAALIVFLVLLVLFAGVNVAASAGLRGIRLDLTENRVYTLSSAAKRVSRTPEEPVTLRYFVSKSQIADLPTINQRSRFVEDTLSAFAAASGGKVVVEVIDPEPASEAEDRAIAEGVRGVPGPSGNLYFGIVGVNAVEGREVIPFLSFQDPQFERFLEFEIARMIDKLRTAERPRLGVVSGLALRGSGGNPALGQRGTPPYQLMAELEGLFEVVDVEEEATGLPGDLDALLVVHPKAMNPGMLYDLDQFMLSGRPAVLFLDPFAETDLSGLDPRDPLSAIGASRGSQAIPTLEAWGVRVSRERVVGDGLAAATGQDPRTLQAVRYVTTLFLRATGDETGELAGTIAGDDPATRKLGSIIYHDGGFITLEGAEDGAGDGGVSLAPLLRTTTQGGTVAVERVGFGVDPGGLLADFNPGGERLTLAARITGEGVASGFPGGPPEGRVSQGHLERSPGVVNVVVVGDADMLADQFWLRPVQLGGSILGYQRLSDNGAFAVNVLDLMAGGGDLIDLRARGGFVRPLAALEAMEASADAAIEAETAALVGRIEEAERRISELEQGRADRGQASSLYLTPEQEAEIDALTAELAESRRQRRRIEYDLRRDIERVKTQITLANTALVPGLLCVFAAGLWGYQAVRRRMDRRRGQG